MNKDLAQNWNEYGDMSRGVAIGFSEELLSGIQHDMPHPSADFNNSIGWNQVYYDSEELSRQFIPLFVDVLRNSPLGWLTVRTTLKHYSAFIKNPTFKDEREVRIVYYPSKDHDQSLNLDFSGLEMEPIHNMFYKIQIQKDGFYCRTNPFDGKYYQYSEITDCKLVEERKKFGSVRNRGVRETHYFYYFVFTDANNKKHRILYNKALFEREMNVLVSRIEQAQG